MDARKATDLENGGGAASAETKKKKKTSKGRKGSRKKSGERRGSKGGGSGGSVGNAGPRRRRSRMQGDHLDEPKTVYEGPGGPACARLLHRTVVIVTDKTIEIEREGANPLLTLLTLGLWYFCFQTASISIYEINHITALNLIDDVIVCTVPKHKWYSAGEFRIDLPLNAAKTTKELFFEMKELWCAAQLDDDNDDATIDLSSEEDGDDDPLLISHA